MTNPKDILGIVKNFQERFVQPKIYTEEQELAWSIFVKFPAIAQALLTAVEALKEIAGYDETGIPTFTPVDCAKEALSQLSQ